MLILTVNAGSSSLKLCVLNDDNEVVRSVDIATSSEPDNREAIESALASWSGIDAVGHRIVHGGTRFSGPVVIDSGVRAALQSLTDLAPLHQPKSLAALDIVSAVLPHIPAVASFDTAFHATLSPAASTYALPAEWRRRWELRRYGFHGLSHAYIWQRTSELLQSVNFRLVSCHLGAGASLAAIKDGRSIDTTMGFTPLEGLVMATRSGSVDPGLLLWLEEHAHMPPGALAETLEHRSGLLGLSGTADMRTLLTRASASDKDANLALDVYIHRLRASIASMAAALGGIDALVFTGGVGQNAPIVRALAAEGLGFLGVEVDTILNEAAVSDSEIGSADSTVRTFTIDAREDLQIANEVRSVVKSD